MVHAQQEYLNSQDEEIYALSLSALKYNNVYSKSFAVDSKLFSYINLYLGPNHDPGLISDYVDKNGWDFIKDFDISKNAKPFKMFSSKTFLNNKDSVVKYSKQGIVNVFSSVVYDNLQKRAVVIYRHNDTNPNAIHWGFLFFEEHNKHWTLLKDVSQRELL